MNEPVVVTTQAELDAALAAKAETIYIESPEGVWLTLTDTDSSRAVLRGSSSAVLWDSSRAELWDSSSAELWDSSSAVLRDSSRAELRDSSSAELRGSSSAELWDSSRAELRGSSSAVLWDSSRAELWDSSSAEAAKYTAVHLRSQRASFTGDGHLIDLTGIDFTDPVQWCEYHGVEVVDGIAYVYKAVGDDWRSNYGFSYEPGSTPEAPDWKATRACGNGLHFCAHPVLSLDFKRNATKFVKCGVRLDELIPLDDKVKARRVVVPCVEVDRHRNVVEAVTS